MCLEAECANRLVSLLYRISNYLGFAFTKREIKTGLYAPVAHNKAIEDDQHAVRDLELRGFVLKRAAIRLNRDGSIALLFEKEVEQKTGDHTRSDGQTSDRLDALLTKIDQKKRGSKGYERAKIELRHAVNHAAKTAIDWENIDSIIMEQLKGMKNKKRWGNKSHHWRIGLLKDRILSWADEHGVRVNQVNPAYTSQTCSSCGHCDKANRSGEQFHCQQCGLDMDADINAAINIRQRGASVSLLHKQRNQVRTEDTHDMLDLPALT